MKLSKAIKLALKDGYNIINRNVINVKLKVYHQLYLFYHNTIPAMIAMLPMLIGGCSLFYGYVVERSTPIYPIIFLLGLIFEFPWLFFVARVEKYLKQEE